MLGNSFPVAVGEVGKLILDKDWSKTSLGPIDSWPHSLRSAVDIMLSAHAQVVVFWGPDFLAFYNDAFAPTIGEKHPGALGRPARESWSELWSDLGPLLHNVFDTGQTMSARDRPFYIERHGYPETVFFDISYSPVRDESGAVLGVFCIVNETTDRVVAQTDLAASEARLKAIFSQASGGIALSDREGGFTLVNQRFCEITGYAEDELLGMRMQDLTHAEDLAANLELFRQLIELGTSYEIEKRYVRKDGSLVWVSNSVGLVRGQHGAADHVLAIVIDITERKRAEEVEGRLAAIITSSQDAILSTDMSTLITSWNGAAESLYGYSAQEAVGRSVSMLIPDDRLDEETSILARIRKGERIASFETKRLRRDGTIIDVSLSVSPILDEHGEVVGASKIARDISDRKQSEHLQRVLSAETQHRVKNIFATVQAIARQTFRGATGGHSAIEAFEARLLAMTKAHDLLHRESWDGAELASVVAEAASPYEKSRFDVGGPAVRLPPKEALALSMALHELATNAAKYGALSVPDGSVQIAWTITEHSRPSLELKWKETGGPTVAQPSHEGFGSRLLRRALAAQLEGKVTVEYESDGVLCVVCMPLDALWGNS